MAEGGVVHRRSSGRPSPEGCLHMGIVYEMGCLKIWGGGVVGRLALPACLLFVSVLDCTQNWSNIACPAPGASCVLRATSDRTNQKGRIKSIPLGLNCGSPFGGPRCSPNTQPMPGTSFGGLGLDFSTSLQNSLFLGQRFSNRFPQDSVGSPFPPLGLTVLQSSILNPTVLSRSSGGSGRGLFSTLAAHKSVKTPQGS